MIDVKTEIIINRSVEEVSEFSANPDNATKWYANIRSAEWQTAKTLSVGSKVAFTAHFLGKKLSYIYEIARYEKGQLLVMKTSEGPFPMETSYTWDKVRENATLMTLRNKGTPSGFSKLFALFMSRAMKRANNKDLRRLKQLMEIN